MSAAQNQLTTWHKSGTRAHTQSVNLFFGRNRFDAWPCVCAVVAIALHTAVIAAVFPTICALTSAWAYLFEWVTSMMCLRQWKTSAWS